MLTATYTLVALSVEHANVRSNLEALQKLLHSSFIDGASLTPVQIGHAADAVKRLVENYHWRKIDMFLIPAIRNAGDQANQLLRELDELGRTAAESAAAVVGSAAARLGSAAADTQAGIAQFCAAIDTFCSASLKRLEREEHDLFPLARAVISGETWFSIANKMMTLDAWVQDSKPQRPASPSMPAARQAAAPLPEPAQPAPQVRANEPRHLAFLAS